jgi:hypothetical protein
MSSAWEVRFSNSRQLAYFYNAQTQQSMWDKPEELTEEQARALPGAERHMPAAPRPVAVEVRASHILCKHAGSRRPSSWREVRCARAFFSPVRLREKRFHLRILLLSPACVEVTRLTWQGKHHPYARRGARAYRTAHRLPLRAATQRAQKGVCEDREPGE